MEKYALESEEYGFFAHFLNDDVCDTLIDAQELVQGIFELNHGMLIYKEPTSTFDEAKADRIEKLVKVSIQIAKRVEAMAWIECWCCLENNFRLYLEYYVLRWK